MANTKRTANFFVIGGTLATDAASYVQRPADDDLLRHTLEGEYCNVLSARQTGKSSLMVKTAERLKAKGVRPVTIDLTSIGSEISASEWYFGLLSNLRRGLELDLDEQAWWQARQEQSPVQRFSEFLREVVLKQIPDPIVVFVDEIDSTLKLNFSDDFFAAIRAAYNARSQDPVYKRLTFVLLGVARPNDLVKDRRRTPYNIGVGIDVTDFEVGELSAFEEILEGTYPGRGRQILEWVLDWTGGQPYLTQKLCAEAIGRAKDEFSKDDLDSLVDQLFLKDKARTETNLRSIRDRTKNNPYAAKMLKIYGQVLAGRQIVAEERSVEQNELKLAGLVRVVPEGNLRIRNRIYSHIFDAAWVKDNTPVSTAQRMTWIAAVVAVIAISLAGYFYYRQTTQTAEVQATTYAEGFNTSASQEVKITNLAGLFDLGDNYAVQARRLFNGLGYEQKLALFDLTAPENVGRELVVVVGGVYQYTENTPDGNTLLRTMSGAVERTNATGATNLSLEINFWVDGREAAGKQDYALAVNSYSKAYEYSQKRKDDNPAILVDRAEAYVALGKYAEALADYDTAIGLDAERTAAIQAAILGNEQLAGYWRDNPSKFANLRNSIPSPTPLPPGVPTSTSTPIPTPTPKVIQWDNNAVSWPQTPITVDNASQIKNLATITLPYHAINFALSPTDEYIAFADDTKVHVVDFLSGREISTFYGHTGVVYCLAYSPDGRFLTTASPGEVGVWDAGRGTLVNMLKGISVWNASCKLVFSPDSTTLAISSTSSIPGALLETNAIRLWRTSDWTLLNTIEDPENDFWGIDISPNGLLGIGTADNSVLLWDIAEGKQIKSFRQGESDFKAVRFFDDGRLIASMNAQGKIFVWNVEDGSLTSSFQCPGGAYNLDVLKNKLLISEDSSDARVYFWDISGKKNVQEVALPRPDIPWAWGNEIGNGGEAKNFFTKPAFNYEFNVTHDGTLLVGLSFHFDNWFRSSKVSLWGIP